jgi:large subunit ribosomal protein L5
MARLHDYYKETVTGQLQEQFKYNNAHQTPQVTKIILNMGIGDARENPKKLEALRKDLSNIAGQHAVATKARVSVANFKIREGYAVGCKVTLRRKNMWEFLDRMISFAIPQIRDFRGLSPKGFDGRGNYSFGLSEQIVFPEISADREHMHGMNIVVVTTAATDNEGRELLRLLGFPFRNLDVVQVASSAKA